MRPPNLTLSTPKRTQPPTIELQTDTENTIITGWEDGYASPLSSASPLPSPTTFRAVTGDTDEITKEFAALDQLRKSVQKNLRLRPIKSQSKLPKVDLTADPSFSPPWDPQEPKTPQTSYFTPDDPFPPSKLPVPSTSRAVEPDELYRRLHATRRPLLIDIRPLALHSTFHIRHSINVAIPTLILKRSRKPGGALQSLESIRQYITTDQGKDAWDAMVSPGGRWDGDIIVYDEEMDERGREKENLHMGWALLAVMRPLLRNGRADYLSGGISKAGHHSDLQTLIDTHDQEPPSSTSQGASGGLFQLKTNQPFHSKSQLELEPSPSTQPSISPLPLMPSFSSNNIHIMDSSPSPPPSQVSFRRPPPPRRPSVPNLQKLDIKTAEAQPKLSLRTAPMKAATLAVPPINTHSLKPSSPSHLKLTYSTHSSSSPGLLSAFPSSPTSDGPPETALSAYFTPPHTPLTPRPSAYPRTPPTARPEDMQPPSAEEEEFPAFAVSTILPSFLFLGPELTAPEHVTELKALGVKQILNIAAECDDDQGLRLTEVFDSYIKIPMRDTVKEENIAKGVRQVCEILDDARLHTVPTYVHCKAGKSRSVTAVMAYLIHANHWTLSRAYQFVLERRKGISPNIGFVLELMTFEEQELGSKSNGVQPPSANREDGQSEFPVAGATTRRGGHARESLPPPLMSHHSMSASVATKMENGQEMEVKDANGRYRHVRRAPVDEMTLQPTRRVSKAGLESAGRLS